MSSPLPPAHELDRLRRVLKLESAGTWEWDLRTQEMSWDRGHRALFGVADTARVTPELFLWLLHPDDRAHVEAVFAEAQRSGHEYVVEYRISRPSDGQQRWIEARGRIEFDGDTPLRAAGIVMDATERRQLQNDADRQRESRVYHAEQFAALFDRNPVPMLVFDAETLRFLEVNEAAVQAYGWSREEFLGLTVLDIRPRDDRAAFRAQLSENLQQTRTESTVRHCTKDGSIRSVNVVGTGIDWDGRMARLVIARDETERRQLEAAAQEARKLEAIGQLAGGIAHDFNNLLTVLVGAVEFARQHKYAPGELDHDLNDIEIAAARARALVTQLLAFSRRQTFQLRSLAINELVQRAAPMLRRVMGDAVAVEVSLTAGEPMIQGDAGLIDQVLLALAFNARDACQAEHAGRAPLLSVTTRRVSHLASDAERWPGLVLGPCVELEFRDTGVGMTPDVLVRAFEPFYTTKPLGSAHGLGLSSVLGIMQQLGGAVRLASEVGVGTSVRLRFPEQTAMAPRRLSGSQPAIAEPQGTVLLAEDEPAVRTAIRRMLQVLGYRVVEAGDGAEALATWRAHRQDVDVIVTDIRMPRMSGPEFAKAVRADAPAFPIIFASGYTDELLAEATTFDQFLDKPFTSARLKEALATVRGQTP
jgi:PAS domain S-box-containing protein